MTSFPTRIGPEVEKRIKLPGFLGKVQRWWEGDGNIGVRDAIRVAQRECKVPRLTAIVIALNPGARESLQDLAKRRVDGFQRAVEQGIKKIHETDEQNR